MELLGGKLALPYECSYAFFAASSALLTFCIVKLNIRFAYYFYIISKNSSQILSSKVASPEKKKYRNLLYLMLFNLIAPLLISILYI